MDPELFIPDSALPKVPHPNSVQRLDPDPDLVLFVYTLFKTKKISFYFSKFEETIILFYRSTVSTVYALGVLVFKRKFWILVELNSKTRIIWLTF